MLGNGYGKPLPFTLFTLKRYRKEKRKLLNYTNNTNDSLSESRHCSSKSVTNYKVEEASTHKSAITHAGTVFCAL